MKNFLKAVTPPIIQSQLKNVFFKKLGYFSGPYATWEQALICANGYQDGNILEKVKQSTIQTCNDNTLFSRDALIDKKVQYSYPLLAAILNVLIENKGRLSVLDFGGALGATYFAFKHYCQSEVSLQWMIVEQPSYVQCANEILQYADLSFFTQIEDIQHRPDIIILSATLQYLSEPYRLLQKLIDVNAKYLLIDRTWFNQSDVDKMIVVEHVPEHIYKSSYPSWLFNYDELLTYCSSTFDIICEFDAIEGHFSKSGFNIASKGVFLRRKAF
jgi:putative methyltransferase (TIGR04325 family)